MIKEIENIDELEPSMDWPQYADPIHQASIWVPERLYPWQVETIRMCMEWGSRTALVTPNESGKSAVVLPVIGLSFMSAFPGAQVVSTAGVERQIKKQLWPKLAAAVRRYPDWRITSGDSLTITAPGVRGLPGSTWVGFSSRDPEDAEGFHPRWFADENGVPVYCPLCVMIDEAKSFNDTEMMFALVQRCSPDILLLASTPGESVGPFFDAFHDNRGKPWKCVEVGWEQCPHLRRGFKLKERLAAIETFGENHKLVQSWVYGEFTRAGSDLVFDDMAAVAECMSGRGFWIRGQKSAAIDFSGGGAGDAQVLGVRDGNRVLPFEIFHEKDDTVLRDILISRFRAHGLRGCDIIADNHSAGKTCIDMLEEDGEFAGIGRYMFNGEPQDQRHYKYRSAEDAYLIKGYVKSGSIMLPDDDGLKKEMRQRRYELIDDDSVVRLEPKKKLRSRGEDSPNKLDVLEMLARDLGSGVIVRNPRNIDNSICGRYQDCTAPAPAAENMQGFCSDGMFMDQ